MTFISYLVTCRCSQFFKYDISRDLNLAIILKSRALSASSLPNLTSRTTSNHNITPPTSLTNPSTMFRTAILRSARRASAQIIRKPCAIARPIVQTSWTHTARFAAPAAFQRSYSAAAGLSQGEVEGRIIDLLKNFDKVRRGMGCGG